MISSFGLFEIYYLEISIIEAMWKIIKTISIRDKEIVADGLVAINKRDIHVSNTNSRGIYRCMGDL